MMRLVIGTLVLLAVPAAQGVSQQGPDPAQPRPPLLLEASRAERLEAAVQLYLSEFIGAIQRADTIALAVLVPDEVIAGEEKPVAARAGCASLGAAVDRLRTQRAGESPVEALPLAGLRLDNVSIALGGVGDTVAVGQARIVERRAGRTRYAPLEVVFVETSGSWPVAMARGLLVGPCGMSVAP